MLPGDELRQTELGMSLCFSPHLELTTIQCHQGVRLCHERSTPF
jgi:hypothetical protein